MATSPTEFQVQSLYVGYLGRAAEISGRDFWVGNLDAGLVTLSQIATQFADSPEYKALYDGLTVPQFVSAVYRNVLGRPGEPSGLQFWTDKVTSGEIARDQLVLEMIEAMSAIDRVRFDTRVQDGNEYTEAAGANYVLADAQEAVALLNFLRASVDGTAATSVDEGQTVQFQFNTIDFFPGQTLTYTITGVSAADVVGGSLSGQVTLDALNQAVVSITLVADALTEGPETLTLSLGGLSTPVTVNDTSVAPPAPVPTFAIAAEQAGYVEGDTAVFNVVTTNVAAGTVLNYTINGAGIDANDIAGGTLTGTVVIGADGKGVINVTTLADATTEGTETLTVTLDGTGASASATLSDTSLSPSYSVAADQASVTEGDSATFTITTANVAAGTVVSYTIGGMVDGADIGGPLTGTATIGSDGKATITVPTVSDGVTEGPETLSVSVSAPGGIVVDASTTLIDSANFRLTAGQDGTASNPKQAEVFDGAQELTGFGLVNTLNDTDHLQGVGSDAVLNAVIGNTGGVTLVTPSMTDVNTVNVEFANSLPLAMALSLEDTKGTTEVNITRISGGQSAAVQNMDSSVTSLSAANTVLPVPNIIFDYRPGQAPSTVALALTGVTVTDLNIGVGALAGKSTVGTGISTLVLTSEGVNTIGTGKADGLDTAVSTLDITANNGSLTINGLDVPSMQTILATGDADLFLGEVGNDPNFALIAPNMTGDITALMGQAAPNAGASFTTGSGNDNLLTGPGYPGDFAADISTDGGNDTVTLNKGFGGWADILGSSTIDMGDGDDVVVDGSTTSISQRLGAGGDGSLSSGSPSFDFTNKGGSLSGSVLLGEGADVLTTGKVTGGSVSGGEGDDVIRTLDISYPASVAGDGGDDLIAVKGNVAGSGAPFYFFTNVLGGEGNDTMVVTGSVVDGGFVDGGAGNDLISTGPVATFSYVNGGTDDDDITINGGVTSSWVDGQSGNDTIRVYGQVSGFATVAGSTGMDKILVDVTPANSGLAAGTTAVSGATVGTGTEDDLLWIRTEGTGDGVSNASLRAGEGNDTLVFDHVSGTLTISDVNNEFTDWNAVQLFVRGSTIDLDMDAFVFGAWGEVPDRVDLIGADLGNHTYILRDMYDAADPSRPDLLVNLTNALADNAPGFDDVLDLNGSVTMNVQVDDRTDSGSDTLNMRLQGPQTFTVNVDDLNGDNTPVLQPAAFENAAVEIDQDRNATLNLNDGDFRGTLTVTGSQTDSRSTTINGASARIIDASMLAASVYLTVAPAYSGATGGVETTDIADLAPLPPFSQVDRVILTGSNNDVVDMRSSTLDGGDGGVFALGDGVNMGAGDEDRLIVGNTTDGQYFGFADRDEAFEEVSNTEILQIDDNANGRTSFFLGDDTSAAGIRTIETVEGSVTTLTTGLRFGGDTGAGDPLVVKVSRTSDLTIDNFNNQNLDVSLWMDRSIDTFGNVTPSAAGEWDTVLNFVRAGSRTVDLTIQIDDSTPNLISSAAPAANGNSELSLVVAPGQGGIDSITLLDNPPTNFFLWENPPVVVVVDDSWAQSATLTIDASGITDDDFNSGTGGVVIDGSAEVESSLVIKGSANDNVLIGGGASSTIDGGVGNDVLIGGALDDTLTGNGGNDYFVGGGGNDNMVGGSGNDYFVGGAGADNITTGGGSDVLDYLVAADSTASNSPVPTHDKIMDFDFALDAFSLSVPVANVGGLITITEGTGTQANYGNLLSFLTSRTEIQTPNLLPGAQALFVQILSPAFASGGINGATGDITLIIVDTNGNDAYDGGDVVVELDDDASYSNPSFWGLNNFGPFGNGMPIATPVITAVVDDTNIVGDFVTSDATLVISGTSDPDASITVFDDANGNGFRDWNEAPLTTTADGAGAWSVMTGVLADDTYTIHAQATLIDGFLKFQSAPSAPQLVTVDTTPPMVEITLSDTSLTMGETAVVTYQFSETVEGFDLADISVDPLNGTLTDFTVVDGDTYTALFTPTVMQAFVNVAKVAAGSYNDIAGNLGTGGTSDNFVIDSVAPSATITLSDTFLLAGETALVTIQFDEAVTDFGLDDLFVGIGALSDFTKVDEDTYEVTLTPIPDAVGGATVDLLPTTYSDLAGNLGGGASAKFVFDTLVPTVAITFDDTELFQGETATVTFEFSEDVTGFDDTDVTVENGALSGFLAVDGNTYTATFTPTDMVFDLTNVATIGAGSYTDLPGNPGAAGESANYEVRTTPAPVPTSVDYDEANNVLRLTGTGFTGVTGVDLTGSVWDFRAAGSSTGTYTFEAGDVLSFKVDSDTLLLITFASETASDIENTTDYGGTLLDIDQIDLLAGAIVVANSSPSVSDLDVTII